MKKPTTATAKGSYGIKGRYFAASAFKAGGMAAERFLSSATGEEQLDGSEYTNLNEAWNLFYRSQSFSHWPNSAYVNACHQFIKGYGRYSATGISPSKLLWPTDRTVGCVICAVDEGSTLKQQLDELMKLPFEEVILVLDGTDEGTRQIGQDHPLAPKVISFDVLLGYDIGRAIGAEQSRSDILLFLDADMVIGAENLLPFIDEVGKGADVVLNSLTERMPVFADRDSVSIVKQFLNLSMHRPDLEADSLTAVPHAITRRGLEVIGTGTLAIPPLAQVRAIMGDLRIVRVSSSVNVFHYNRIRSNNVGHGNPAEQMILGDHLEALHYATEAHGPRMSYSDFNRDREIACKDGEETA
ncbi:glycosyltransferase family 2 protein [Gorillibacterium massiliense]|uniref:glycosyltransferase family 2 protein n=1 Tax=Gorillibacterium massiliense TaxID=1280390 RepID=UPI000693EEA3|nr:glycosyltransferase [Gorillibacterium massiliense]